MNKKLVKQLVGQLVVTKKDENTPANNVVEQAQKHKFLDQLLSLCQASWDPNDIVVLSDITIEILWPEKGSFGTAISHPELNEKVTQKDIKQFGLIKQTFNKLGNFIISKCQNDFKRYFNEAQIVYDDAPKESDTEKNIDLNNSDNLSHSKYSKPLIEDVTPAGPYDLPCELEYKQSIWKFACQYTLMQLIDMSILNIKAPWFNDARESQSALALLEFSQCLNMSINDALELYYGPAPHLPPCSEQQVNQSRYLSFIQPSAVQKQLHCSEEYGAFCLIIARKLFKSLSAFFQSSHNSHDAPLLDTSRRETYDRIIGARLFAAYMTSFPLEHVKHVVTMSVPLLSAIFRDTSPEVYTLGIIVVRHLIRVLSLPQLGSVRDVILSLNEELLQRGTSESWPHVAACATEVAVHLDCIQKSHAACHTIMKQLVSDKTRLWHSDEVACAWYSCIEKLVCSLGPEAGSYLSYVMPNILEAQYSGGNARSAALAALHAMACHVPVVKQLRGKFIVKHMQQAIQTNPGSSSVVQQQQKIMAQLQEQK